MQKPETAYWRTQALIVFLAVIAVVLGFRFVQRNFFSSDASFQEAAVTQAPVSEDISPEEEALETREEIEKTIARLLFAPVTVGQDEEAVADFNMQYSPGGITLFGSDIATESAQAIIETFKQSNPEIHVAVDHEGGTVQRLSGTGFVVLPAWQTLCTSSRVERIEVLRNSYSQLASVGVDIIFAPVVDLFSTGSALGTRACRDLDDTVAAASDAVEVAQEVGVTPVLKHYPGLEGVTVDTHDEFASVEVSRNQLLAFSRVLEVFPVPVMVAHVGIEGKDTTRPCTVYPDCISVLLRQYPEVITFTDALEMEAARYSPSGEPKSLERVSIEALLAGNTVLVYGKDVTPDELVSVIQALADEYQASQLFAGLVDDAVKRLDSFFVEREQ